MTVGTETGPEWRLQKATAWMLGSPEVGAQLSPLGRMLLSCWLWPMETSVFFSVVWGWQNEVERGNTREAAAALPTPRAAAEQSPSSVCPGDLLCIQELLLPRNPFPRVAAAAAAKSKQGNLQPRGRHPLLSCLEPHCFHPLCTVSWFSTVPCR